MKKIIIIILVLFVAWLVVFSFKSRKEEARFFDDVNKTEDVSSGNPTINNTNKSDTSSSGVGKYTTGEYDSSSTPGGPSKGKVVVPGGGGSTGLVSGLSYVISVTENGATKNVTLFNNPSYNFASDYYVTVWDSDKTTGIFKMVFRPSTGPDMSANLINSNPVSSTKSSFSVDYNQVFEVKVGQTVNLNGTSIKVSPVSDNSSPCPKGAMC